MFIKWIKLVPLSWGMTIASWLLSPLISLLSIIKGSNELGYPWAYFYTQDASLDGGWEQKKEGYGDPATVGWKKLWWQRVKWICRNPSYRFNAEVLGFLHEGYKVISETNPTADWGTNTTNYVVMEDAKGERYFSYRANIDIGGKRYIKLWIGWNTMAYGGVYHQLKSLPGSLKKRA